MKIKLLEGPLYFPPVGFMEKGTYDLKAEHARALVARGYAHAIEAPKVEETPTVEEAPIVEETPTVDTPPKKSTRARAKA